MSILNILHSTTPPHADFVVFGMPFTIEGIIYTMFTLIVPFYYGLYISNSKQYYLSLFFLFFNLLSMLYYALYISALMETGEFYFVPLSEIHERAMSISLEVPFYMIYSFCFGFIIKWALKKYPDNQLRTILSLVLYSLILLICGYIVSIAIVSTLGIIDNLVGQFQVNNDAELKPGQNAPVTSDAVETWAFAMEVQRQHVMISLHSLYFLISGLIWSAYIYRKNRKIIN